MTNVNTFQGDVFIHEYIKHTGDDNNLFGFSGTDTFKIATAGTDAIKVDASQNIDITGLIRHIGDENNLFGFSGTDTFKIATAGTDRLTVDSSGQVTIPGVAVIDSVYRDTFSYSGSYNTYKYIGRFSAYSNGRVEVTSAGNSQFNTNTFDFQRQYAGQPYVSGINSDNYINHRWFYKSANVYEYDVWHYIENAGAASGSMTYRIQAHSYSRPSEPSSSGRAEFLYGIIQHNEPGQIRVAISRTSGQPFFPLHIQGSGVNATQSPWQWWAWVTNPNFKTDYRSQQLSDSSAGVGITGTGLYSHASIGCNSYLYSHGGGLTGSDTRIKCDIIDIEDGEALNMLRLLKPKQYNYKDVYNRGADPVLGFIAQEVGETIPSATKLIQEYIPNIYQLGTVSNSNVITFTNFNTSNLESNVSLIRLTDFKDENHFVRVANIINENSIQFIEDISEMTNSYDETGNVVSGNQIFVFGQRIDDFHFLKKDSIWTVATAALQEVDRQLQAEQEKVTTLETQLTSVLTRLDALESA